MKFKSDIEVQAGLKDSSGSIGTSGQVLSSTGSNVSWINQSTVASDVQNQVKAGVAINKGQAVYVTGADGTNIIVGLASNASEATSSKTLGLLDATVAINGFANVVQIGRLSGLNTLGATAGDPVWLGTGGNLIYGLINKPYAPAHLVFIGIVTRVNVSNGEIFVNVQNGFELNEIHDVDLKTTVPISGDILGFNGTLWVNKTIAGWLGYIPANANGTVNYVSKFTGATTLGNSLLFDNGTNVGIGTSSPSQKLHVVGNIIADDLTLGGSESTPTINFTSSGSARASLDYNNSNGVITLENKYGLFAIKTGSGGSSSERMRITSAGNVGIGTTSPGSLLQVGQSSSNTDSLIRLSVGYSTDRSSRGGITWNDTTNVTGKIYTEYDGTMVSMVFGSLYNSGYNSSQRMVIRGNGFVGIGTPSPTEPLQVAGNTVIEGKLNLQTVNNGIGNFLTINTPTGFIEQRTAAEVLSDIGAQAALTNPVTGTGTLNFVSKFTSTGSTLGDSQIFDNGTNVGIGTASPAGKLNALGDIIAGSFTYTTGVNLQNRTAKSLLYISTDGVNNAIGSTITYSWVDGGQGPLKFNNTSGEVMRLDAIGKLGVGTTNPTSRIHSVSNSSGPVSYDNRCAVFGYNTATETTFNNGVGIAGRVLTSGGMAVYGDATTGSGWAGYFDGKGYFSADVGIGTNILGAVTYGSTPQLVVASATGGVMDLRSLNTNIVDTNLFGRLQFSGKDDASVAYATAAIEAIAASTAGSGSGGGGVLKFMTAAPGVTNSPQERMRINSSGNVGIGTITPSYPLDVNGVAILRNALYMTAGGSSSTPAWSFAINGSGDLVVDEAIVTRNFIFSNAGQVLIGTTISGTPTYGSAPQFVTSSSTGGVIDIKNNSTVIGTGALLGRVQFTAKSDAGVGYTAAAIDVITSNVAGTGSSGGGILRFMTAAAGGGQTPTARMWINQLGYVSIGLTNTASYPLRVTTQVSNISIYADYDIVALSDQSVKENIRPIENVIERVQKSRGVLYDRIDSGEKDNIGFIAQELEVAFPELVSTNENGTKAVKYQNAVAVLFEAVKEQQKQIDEIKQILNGLTN